jgi:DNA repair exonuclease SbcCD ATPase subunit
MRYRLKSIEIEAFRGVRSQLKMPLDKPLVIIYGPNGAGKSTVTTAIEWALFPKEAVLLTEHAIRERTGWELKHIHSDEQPHVRLVLTNENGDRIIDRGAAKGKKNGKQSADEKQSFNCSYADFKSLAFMHQETIRDFLIGQPKPREDAFQRLLGAGWAQDLAEAIDDATKKLHCDDADQRVGKLDTDLNGRMQEAARLVKEKERAAELAGLKSPWEEEAQNQVGDVTARIEQLCKQLAIESSALPKVDDFKAYSSKLKTFLDKLRVQGPAETHTQLSARKTKLQGARKSFKTALDAVNEKGEKLKATQQQVGTKEKVTQRIEDLTQKREGLKARLKSLDLERSVMCAALDYLKSSPGAKACPACLREGIPQDVVNRLKDRLDAESTAEEQKVQEQLREVEGQLNNANGHLRILNESAQGVQDSENHLQEQHKELETVLGRQLRQDESPLEVADAEIQQLATEIGNLTEAVRQLQNRVTEIENVAKKVDEIGQILSLQERVSNLGRIRETLEWQTMVEARRALAQREQQYKLGSNAVRLLAAKVAQHNLDRARQPITEIYRQMAKRGDFPDISIDPERKFAIAVSGQTGSQQITAILNQTDLDALAIAVVAGMATTFPEVHDFDFLILDDPSQGMDPQVAGRLAEVISKLSENIQVVVATPDLNLFKELKKSTRAKRLIELKSRDPESATPFVQLECLSPD